MKSLTKCELRGLVFGALSLASVTGCAANVDDAYEETTATTDEGLLLTQLNPYRWLSDDTVTYKTMGPTSSTFCFLTDVYGNYTDAYAEVKIVAMGGNWTLTGAAYGMHHGAQARCVAAANTNPKIWDWPTHDAPPSDPYVANDLKPSSTHVCFLTGLGGVFGSTQAYVRTSIRSDGKWVLEGNRPAGSSVHASAMCVPTTGILPHTNNPIGEQQRYRGLFGLTYYNPGHLGPVNCGLTRIGGALGVAGVGYPKAELSEYVWSPGYRWQLAVNGPNLGFNADAYCFQ